MRKQQLPIRRNILISLLFFPLFLTAQDKASYEAQRPPELITFFKRVEAAMMNEGIDTALSLYDSLYERAEVLKDTLSMVQAKSDQGELLYMMRKTEAAKFSFLQSNQYASTLPFVEYEGYNLLRLGNIFEKKGQIDSAFIQFHKAQELLPKAVENTFPLQLNNNLGILYNDIGKGDSAAYYFLKALPFVDENDAYKIGSIYNNLGKTFSFRFNYDKAIHYFDTALAGLSLENHPNSYAITLANKAMSLQLNGQIQKAYDTIEEAHQIVKENDIDRLKMLTYSVYASVLSQMDRKEEALTIFDELEEIGIDSSSVILPEYLLTKISLFLTMDNLEEVAQLLPKAKVSIQKQNLLPYQIKYHRLKAIYLQKKGQFEQAYQSIQTHNLYKDSLFSIRQSNIINDLETQYATVQKEQRINQLELEESLQSTKISRQNWIIFLGGISLLLLGGLTFSVYNKNEKIEAQNSIIQKALKEKEILLKEIHHRVKNNLQVISSLLGIQSRKTKDAVALEALKEGRARVQTMSLIHQNLYKENHLSGIAIDDYIKKQSQSLLNTYSIHPEQVALHTDVDPLLLDVDSVVPIGLIINELMSNALKYAFPDNRKGLIQLSLKEEEKGLRLSVKDDGVGVKNMETLKNKDSFGYELIDAFTQKLNADLITESINGLSVQLLIRNYQKV